MNQNSKVQTRHSTLSTTRVPGLTLSDGPTGISNQPVRYLNVPVLHQQTCCQKFLTSRYGFCSPTCDRNRTASTVVFDLEPLVTSAHFCCCRGFSCCASTPSTSIASFRALMSRSYHFTQVTRTMAIGAASKTYIGHSFIKRYPSSKRWDHYMRCFGIQWLLG